MLSKLRNYCQTGGKSQSQFNQSTRKHSFTVYSVSQIGVLCVFVVLYSLNPKKKKRFCLRSFVTVFSVVYRQQYFTKYSCHNNCVFSFAYLANNIFLYIFLNRTILQALFHLIIKSISQRYSINRKLIMWSYYYKLHES